MTQPRLLGGRYELDAVIGRGGMAEVYRARDIRLDRVVAIKTLRSDLARDQTFQARFRREAQSAASLNHPSIIAVYDTGEDMIGDNPVPFIVMEYCEGRTLRDVLREEQRLVPERAMEMVDGILRALDYSHRGGIVHRDIKPANVMLTSNGEVKVMDFGIARALADSAATMTATAQVIGTAQYLSPEQARGERVDARSDLYSTGCVLYELLTGQPPFSGDSPVAIAYQHVREEPVPPSRIDPQIPRWADSITLKALAKDPEHRYQNAAEMRGDIQRALQGMPVANTATTMAMAQGTQVMGSQTQMTRAATGYDLPPVDYGEPARRKGNGKKIALWTLAGLLAVGAVAALLFIAFSGGGDGGGTKVPSDIVGLTEAAAKQKLTQAGIPASNIETKDAFNKEEKGTVFKSEPAPGSEVDKEKDKVTLFVSKGQEQVVVPQVKGMDRDQAREELEEAGFEVSTEERAHQSVGKDRAIRTDPPGGSKEKKGTRVTLFVSKGPNLEVVPAVVGKNVDEAITLLQEVGFRPVKRVISTPGPPDIVARQNPPGNQQAPKGSTVTIFVPKEQPTTPPTTPPPPGSNDRPMSEAFRQEG